MDVCVLLVDLVASGFVRNSPHSQSIRKRYHSQSCRIVRLLHDTKLVAACQTEAPISCARSPLPLPSTAAVLVPVYATSPLAVALVLVPMMSFRQQDLRHDTTATATKTSTSAASAPTSTMMGSFFGVIFTRVGSFLSYQHGYLHHQSRTVDQHPMQKQQFNLSRVRAQKSGW